MKKQVRSLVWVAGLTSLAVTSVGCMDFAKEVGGGSPVAVEAAKHPHRHHAGSPDPTASPSSAPVDAIDVALSGYWTCSAKDAGCDASAVKLITEKQNSISTDETLLVPAQNPTSICRVHENAQLSVSESADGTELNGSISDAKGDVSLVASNENTQNCADIVQDKIKDAKSAVSDLVYDQTKKTLTIDNVAYTRVMLQQGQSLIAQHSNNAALTVDSLAGKWLCVDSECDNDSIYFSNKPLDPPTILRAQPQPNSTPTQTPAPAGLQKIVHRWVMNFSDQNLKCLVSEESAFSIYDQDNLTEVYAVVTPSGSLSPHSAAENTDDQKCADAADAWSQSEGPKTHSASHVPIFRDGACKLTFEKKHYVSSAANCPFAGH